MMNYLGFVTTLTHATAKSTRWNQDLTQIAVEGTSLREQRSALGLRSCPCTRSRPPRLLHIRRQKGNLLTRLGCTFEPSHRSAGVGASWRTRCAGPRRTSTYPSRRSIGQVRSRHWWCPCASAPSDSRGSSYTTSSCVISVVRSRTSSCKYLFILPFADA